MLALTPLAPSQTIVTPSQRQSKASDFAPVLLPTLDRSLLQSLVSVSRPPLPDTPSFQLQFDPTPTFTYPYARAIY